MKLLDRYEFTSRLKCECRCVCDNERLRNQPLCNYCFLMDHDSYSLIGPPKPARFAEQRTYMLDDGRCEIR